VLRRPESGRSSKETKEKKSKTQKRKQEKSWRPGIEKYRPGAGVLWKLGRVDFLLKSSSSSFLPLSNRTIMNSPNSSLLTHPAAYPRSPGELIIFPLHI
jgi:hypothetical protein